MGNRTYNKTTLWSDDAANFDEVTRDLIIGQQGDEIEREPGKIQAVTMWDVPDQEIRELSAKYPEMTFFTEYSYEDDFYSKIHTVEYKKGEARHIKIEPGYSFFSKHEFEDIMQNVPCYAELEAKATEIFKRLDVQIKGPDGHLDIDWCKDEVTVTVEQDGHRMQATKKMNDVYDIILFKAKEIKTVEWHQLNSSGIRDEDLPF